MQVLLRDGDLLDQPAEVIVNACNRNIVPWLRRLPRARSSVTQAQHRFVNRLVTGQFHTRSPNVSSAAPIPGILHVTGSNKYRRFPPFQRHYIQMPLEIHWTALLLAATAVPAWPQVRFEVASIRPSQPGMTARDARHNFHGDRFEAKAMTVGDVLDMLNGYQLFRVVGGPAWMRTDRYDIVAKAEGPLEIVNLRPAVMALLSDRFQLVSHREEREVPGIVLRAPRRPTGLKQAAADEVSSIRTVNGDVVFTAVSMSRVTNYLSQMWSAPVMDETGLTGANDFELPTSRVESKSG